MNKKRNIPLHNTLNYGILHSHYRQGGVRTVMENSVISLTKYGDYKDINISFFGAIKANIKESGIFSLSNIKIKNINIDELGYGLKKYKNKEELLVKAKILMNKIISEIQIKEFDLDNPYILHIHNTNLGKSALVCEAISLLADFAENKPIVLIIQAHDFIENGRYNLLKHFQTCTGKDDKLFAANILYPIKRNIIYATINPGDVQNLIDIGIDKKRIFLLPNAIDVSKFSKTILNDEIKDQIISRITEFSKKNKYYFDKDKKIILAPLKVLRRKNIVESILILKLLGEEYQLIISLDAASKEDKAYSNKIKKFIRKYKIPVIIGIGHEIISPKQDRIIKDGKIELFCINDLYNISDTIITTSLVEGFGFVFHEPWLNNKFVIGRKIPCITNAYEDNGMDLSHLYTKLNISPNWINLRRIKKQYFAKVNKLRKKQGISALSRVEFETEFSKKKLKNGFIDFGNLDVESQITFLKNFERYKTEFIKVNNEIIQSLKMDKDKISKNDKISREFYGLKANADRLSKLFSISKDLIKEPFKNKQADNTRVIEKYIDLENIRLLI